MSLKVSTKPRSKIDFGVAKISAVAERRVAFDSLRGARGKERAASAVFSRELHDQNKGWKMSDHKPLLIPNSSGMLLINATRSRQQSASNFRTARARTRFIGRAKQLFGENPIGKSFVITDARGSLHEGRLEKLDFYDGTVVLRSGLLFGMISPKFESLQINQIKNAQKP
jgi:hypothetical protein